jgi:hypothetical protein
MPTLLLFNNGQVTGQIVGAVTRFRIEELVARAGVAPRNPRMTENCPILSYAYAGGRS